MKCPKCEREWPDGCEQAECVRRHGECICCRFLPRGAKNLRGSGAGTDAEFDALTSTLWRDVDVAKPGDDRTTYYPPPPNTRNQPDKPR